jgi:ABC-2 type transport system ATP-binding protein
MEPVRLERPPLRTTLDGYQAVRKDRINGRRGLVSLRSRPAAKGSVVPAPTGRRRLPSAPPSVRSASRPQPHITARDLGKTYTFHQQRAGLVSALRQVLRRRYETRRAVDGVSFTIRPGETVGVLGRNGAGKTTLLKMLAGLLHPSEGQLDVLGFRPADRKPAYLRQISLVMGQKTMLWWDVPAMETFLLHKEMYALTAAEFDESVGELAGLLGVERLLDVQVRKVSLGERMKLELLAALLHRPRILFLDEPTIGLDVESKARVRSFLAEVNQRRGTTIVLTSHDMADIEALCARVLVVDGGKIAYDGSLADLDHDSAARS